MGKDYKVIFDNLALSITRRSVSSHPYDVEMYIADDHLCSMSGLVHMTSAEALALANAIYDDLGMGLDTDLAKAQAKSENLINKIQRVKKFIDFALSEHEKGEHSFELWSALRQAKRIIRETLESEE